MASRRLKVHSEENIPSLQLSDTFSLRSQETAFDFFCACQLPALTEFKDVTGSVKGAAA